MKTIKLNLTDQVTKLSTDEDSTSNGNQNSGNNVSASQYKNQINKLEKQIKMMEESLQNAREEAFQAGIEEGKEQAQLEIKEIEKEYQSNYKDLLESIDNKFSQALKNAAEPLLELAYMIAEKIIERELRYKDDYTQFLEKQLNKHITDIIDQGRLTIQLHPEQLPNVTTDTLSTEITSQNRVHIIENSELKPGDCIIETNDIKIDARISRQLENLKFQNDNIE